MKELTGVVCGSLFGIISMSVSIDSSFCSQPLGFIESLRSLVRSYARVSSAWPPCLLASRHYTKFGMASQNPVHVFSSPSIDLRFLGSTIKTLTTDDLKYTLGGLPGAAIITFIGYGVASINAFQAGSRIILNNGTHRVYALRSLGVTHIPIAIQKIDPSSPILNQILGGASQYLSAHPRPIFMKDFFNDDFTLTVNVPRFIQTVTVIVNQDTHGVPT